MEDLRLDDEEPFSVKSRRDRSIRQGILCLNAVLHQEGVIDIVEQLHSSAYHNTRGAFFFFFFFFFLF